MLFSHETEQAEEACIVTRRVGSVTRVALSVRSPQQQGVAARDAEQKAKAIEEAKAAEAAARAAKVSGCCISSLSHHIISHQYTMSIIP